MRAHYFQHVPFEGIGSIEPWLTERGYVITHSRLYQGEAFPSVEDIDLLVVMGGPMSVNDEAEFPWLVQEKGFVRECIEKGKPVLGICLGAQLIASSLGKRVFPNGQKEIGWWPIHCQVKDVGAGIFRFPETLKVFHWHGETFDLPEGAQLLASSAACTNQAFQLGKNVIGLQFHLETTLALAREITHHCAEELLPGEFIQSADKILSATAIDYMHINRCMGDVLAFITR